MPRLRCERITNGQVALWFVTENLSAPVLPDIAEKVRERDAASVVDLNAQVKGDSQPDEDDPYKDFEVPDDLVW